jgi:hypothetical protein
MGNLTGIANFTRKCPKKDLDSNFGKEFLAVPRRRNSAAEYGNSVDEKRKGY